MTTLALILLVIAAIFIVQSIKVVPQQHAWVVERLGKYNGTLTPGLSFLMPFIDRVAYKHLLKEVPLDIASQVCITRDNTQLQVDGIHRRYDAHPSGFGPYEQARLARQTGGVFFLLPSPEANLWRRDDRIYDADAMRPYLPNLAARGDYAAEALLQDRW